VEGNTPLHVAAEAPKNEIATVQCLLENGADANALNYIGAAPLHYVCLRKSNYRGVANILLENGAQINQQTVAGKSALHFACENQIPELVEVLCLFGADVNLPDFEGNMPGHLTLLKVGGRDTVKREILQHLTNYAASFAYANSEGYTPLHLACHSGCIRCVQYLVEGDVPKADVAAVTLRGQNGLHLACLSHHAEVATLILQVYPGALDLQDGEGNTPLHCCAVVGSLDCAQLLLQKEANTTLRNAQKKTAYDLANIRTTDLSNCHNPELVQILKEAKKGGACRQS
jgi:ankyrin repeat protein